MYISRMYVTCHPMSTLCQYQDNSIDRIVSIGPGMSVVFCPYPCFNLSIFIKSGLGILIYLCNMQVGIVGTYSIS